MNTFMMETRRPSRSGDKDSLIMHVVSGTEFFFPRVAIRFILSKFLCMQSRKSGQTTIRHLLSADTREERLGWCAVVNKALANLRAWDPTAFRPRVHSQSSISSSESGTSTDIW